MGPTEEDKADVKAFHDASQGVGLKRNYRDASNTSVSDGSLRCA